MAKEFLTAEEVAEALGVNRKTIYRMFAKKQIPGVIRVGRQYRVLREVFIEACREGRLAAT